MGDLFDALKDIFSRYDVPTRRLIWKRLNTAKGHELVEKILRNSKPTFLPAIFANWLMETDLAFYTCRQENARTVG